MKAVFLTKYGSAEKAFEIRETPKPVCGDEDVLIEVECFGLNYAEVMARRGLYQSAPKAPSVLGYEVVGIIREVGKKTDSSWIGKRVVAFTRFGGYAQFAVTSKDACAEIGDMDAGEACCIAVQYATAYYMAYEMCNLHEGDKVLIHAGAGGVGTALIQLCALKRCEIFANAGSDEKLTYMKKQGATHVMNYRKENYADVFKKQNQKFDVIFNPIAGSTFKKDYNLLDTGGRLLLFGASERSGKKWGIFSTLALVAKMGRIIPIMLLAKSRAVIGVNMLNVGDYKPHVLARCMKNVVELVQQNKLNPHVGHRFKALEIGKAHELLESRNSMGKIVVYW